MHCHTVFHSSNLCQGPAHIGSHRHGTRKKQHSSTSPTFSPTYQLMWWSTAWYHADCCVHVFGMPHTLTYNGMHRLSPWWPPCYKQDGTESTHATWVCQARNKEMLRSQTTVWAIAPLQNACAPAFQQQISDSLHGLPRYTMQGLHNGWSNQTACRVHPVALSPSTTHANCMVACEGRWGEEEGVTFSPPATGSGSC